MTVPMLEISGLRHTYGAGPSAHTAIDGLGFTVRQGEFVSIVGPSGAGKTTLLKAVSGLLRPTAGDLALLGTPIVGVPTDLAVVFQDYSRSLLPWRTVEANVDFPLVRRGLGRGERTERVAESLHAVGLDGFADRYPWQLSGGMQQRVAIARALACRAQLLLMDEPFASVDAQTRADLEDLVLSVFRDFDVTILFVTHDIDESVYLADRVLVLSRPPSRVIAEIEVPLARPRDQIATKELPEFVRLRGEVARLIRRPGETPAPAPAAAAV